MWHNQEWEVRATCDYVIIDLGEWASESPYYDARTFFQSAGERAAVKGRPRPWRRRRERWSMLNSNACRNFFMLLTKAQMWKLLILNKPNMRIENRNECRVNIDTVHQDWRGCARAPTLRLAALFGEKGQIGVRERGAEERGIQKDDSV